jgi:spore coat protein CotF
MDQKYTKFLQGILRRSYEIVKNLTGMGGITEQVIATDCLMDAKAGKKNYAIALTETSTQKLGRLFAVT